MSYKMVCIDMDGTLLNSQHRISEVSKETLKKAHDKGVKIVLSSGRMYTDVKAFSTKIGLKSPVIASNGAIAKEKGTKEVIYKSALSEKVCLLLLDLILKHNIGPMFCTTDKAYCGSLQAKMFMEYAKASGAMDKSIKTIYICSKKQWSIILKKEKDKIIKCEVLNKNSEKLEKIIEDLKKIDEIDITNSSKFNIEVSNKGISKGAAVKALAEYYNIKREEIIAFGDSANDLSMIEYAGLGVAMGNALDSAKEVADYITDTNDNNGVAKAIEKFIFQENE